MDVGVVVVNWNSWDSLSRLLCSLAESRGLLREVVVVDNHSDDAGEQVVQSFPWVRWVKLDRNIGFAAAANLALRSVRTSRVFLLNPDLEVPREAMAGLLEAAEEHPGAAIYCGRLVDQQGRTQDAFQYRRLPTIRTVLKDALFLEEVGAGLGVRESKQLPSSGPVPVEQPAGAFWLLDRRIWQQLGGLDEGFYPAWFEDVDFCRRLRDAGLRALAFPEYEARHVGGVSLSCLGRDRFLRIYYGNLIRYWRKHHPGTLVLVWPAVQLGLGLRLAIERFRS